MATAADILKQKGSEIHTVPDDLTVLEAVRSMNQHRIGAVVVTHEGQVRGIFTERDVLRRVVEEQRRPEEIPLTEVMSTEVICVRPEIEIDEVSRIMKDRRVRHLPVCDIQGHLLGMVSIGDLNAYHASEKEATIHTLHEYIYGPVLTAP